MNYRYCMLPIADVVAIADTLINSTNKDFEVEAHELVAEQLEFVLLENYHLSPVEHLFSQVGGVSDLTDWLHDACVALIAQLGLVDYEQPCGFEIQGTDWIRVTIDYDYNAMFKDEYQTAV